MASPGVVPSIRALLANIGETLNNQDLPGWLELL
jgi:hypothetical protein